MKRLFLIVCVACVAALSLPAQLVLRSGPDPVSGTLTLPQIYATDLYEAKLNLVNTGSQPVAIATLSIAGTSFSLPGAPATPRQLAIGESLPFIVRFAPIAAGSFSAVLQAGTLTVFVLEKSLPGATLFDGEAAVHLPGGVDFGRIETGTSVMRHFSLRNQIQQTLSMATILATSDFALPDTLQLPVVLPPGSSIAFDVIAKPQQAGAMAGNLIVDGRQFPLSAFAFDAQFPSPSFVFQDLAVKSARQSRLSIALGNATHIAGAGSVEFAFELLTNGLAGDPGVVFPATGTRSMNFTVEPGDTTARFGADAYADFQTGTTAGNLVFRVRFGEWLETATLTIAPDLIGVDRFRATRSAKSIDVEIAGFDNTRSASKLTFTFFASDGAPVSPGAIPVEAADSFRSYFQTAGLGGMFSLKAAFPVTGGSDRISGLEVEMVNSQGTIRTQRIGF